MGVVLVKSVRLRLGRSMPSLSHWLTKTMATWEVAASAAAALALLPSLNCTLAPGTMAWMAFSGELGSQMTCDQQGGHGWVAASAGPPTVCTCKEAPPERTYTSASEPMTAMEIVFALNGSWALAFFSSTAPFS